MKGTINVAQRQRRGAVRQDSAVSVRKSRGGKVLFLEKCLPQKNIRPFLEAVEEQANVLKIGILNEGTLNRDAGCELPAIYRDFMSRDSQYKTRDETLSASLDNLRCRDGIESLCQVNKFPILGF